MKHIFTFSTLLFLSIPFQNITAQKGESTLGGWYAYNFSHVFGESEFGVIGDFQHRNYEVAGDFQQLIVRAGLSWTPKDFEATFLAGYAHFNSGTFGESNIQVQENRLYQDILLSNKLGSRVKLGHRFRFEERFIEDRDFRFRFRYAIAVRIPLNKKTMERGALFFVGNSEIFVNGNKDIGNGVEVPLFDRNWSAAGMGYGITNDLRMELTYMRETTETISKGQLWLAVFHKIN